MGQGNKAQQFKILYTENYSRLYYSALYFLHDSEVAKDMVNDVFTEIWEHFDPLRIQYTFAYLYTNVHNRCIDYSRHVAVENQFVSLYREMNREMTLSEAKEKDERLDVIYEVLKSLPQKTQFVVEQCYFNDKKYTEVADILGITTDGVRKHIMKALSAIREHFSVNYKKGQYPKDEENR